MCAGGYLCVQGWPSLAAHFGMKSCVGPEGRDIVHPQLLILFFLVGDNL